jgi:dihydroorotase
MRLLIKNGRIVDPANGVERAGDLLIDSGRIVGVEPRIDRGEVPILDATGLLVVPGLIDLHVHLREPGLEHKETIETGTAAAAAGGFTAVAAMANTLPVNDNAAVTAFIRRRAAEVGKAQVYPVGAISKGLAGKELAEIGELVEAGAVAISDDGRPVEDANLFRRALEYAKAFDIPVIEHCETPALHPGGVMNEGYWSTALGLRGIPAASEEIAVRRSVVLAEMTGGRVHIAHLSTRGGLQAVREAKAKGLSVTCEVTPHHLLLTDESVKTYDTHTKMNPPLRSEEDRQALLAGLADGTIDAIATDHAPHHQDEKRVEFDHAPFGVIGLETAVPLALDRLVGAGVMSLSRLVELFSVGPARILGLKKGSLAVGADADVTLLDPERPFIVRPESFQSKGRNTPFAGLSLRGQAVLTLVGGRIVWDALGAGTRVESGEAR